MAQPYPWCEPWCFARAKATAMADGNRESLWKQIDLYWWNTNRCGWSQWVFGDFTGAISQGRGSNELSVCATSWSISDWFLCSLDNDCRAIDHHFRRVCLWDFQFASAGYKALLQIRKLTTRKFLQAGWPNSVESTTTNLMKVAPHETLQNMHATICTCNIEEHNCSKLILSQCFSVPNILSGRWSKALQSSSFRLDGFFTFFASLFIFLTCGWNWYVMYV